MQTRSLKVQSPWLRIARLISITGLILSLGSIFTFIVMNAVMGEVPSIESVYWQRLFVSRITEVLILPGVGLLVVGAIILSLKQYGFFRNTWISVLQILVVLIVINSVNITLLAGRVTEIAVRQWQTSVFIPEYMNLKSAEDIFGAVNVVMMIICLIVPFYKNEN
ncbi:MAG TPA: hypothetical protein DEO70_14695 [Bacteroidales bacterium]|nr:MAG: hypothetical protein A2X11_06500 [Bacteroidetes bacterium GWE2_42_24]OFY25663.1 MAG: hypothetical protein A2X09_01725 [Bacteroidetes bacterium GWF2_43_11]HBZ68079.1 hypothetical protein [Bacteroidales bacterium]